MAQKTCFVVMGFGKKTDFETGRTRDLDKSYQYLIKPAVEAAGLTCIRADEIVHSGVIDVPMYTQLLSADVVVADLSTSNKNALYELGIRHALKPYSTIVIAEEGLKVFPFDVNHVAIRQYKHLGEDIGYSEVQRFQKLLTEAIKAIAGKSTPDNDSPVYTFLANLTPPSLLLKQISRDISEALASDFLGGTAEEPVGSDSERPSPPAPPIAVPKKTLRMLMEQIDEAQDRGDFITAKALLTTIRKSANPNQPEDPYMVQRMALLTYKSELPTKEQALHEAEALLLTLDPQTTNDTETLGLWAAVNKRLYEVTSQLDYLSKAIRASERGFYLRNDLYNGINLAFLLNLRAAASTDRAEATADFVQARRIRQEVLDICHQWLADNPIDTNGSPQGLRNQHEKRYWVLATIAQAQVGLGDTAAGDKQLQEANQFFPDDWMRQSTEAQIDQLKALLSDSPTKYITQ